MASREFEALRDRFCSFQGIEDPLGRLVRWRPFHGSGKNGFDHLAEVRFPLQGDDQREGHLAFAQIREEFFARPTRLAG